MVEKMKNLFANIVMYLGTFIVMFGQKVTELGIKLHIKLNTQRGQKFKEVRATINTLKEMIFQQNKKNTAGKDVIFIKN